MLCPPDRYGLNCLEVCRCENGGKCDHISGECFCNKGFAGPLCEDRCTEGNNIEQCKSECRCQNGGNCDASTGSCKCPPGWTGSVCANRCQANFFGQNCGQLCECFNGADCHHISGKKTNIIVILVVKCVSPCKMYILHITKMQK